MQAMTLKSRVGNKTMTHSKRHVFASLVVVGLAACGGGVSGGASGGASGGGAAKSAMKMLGGKSVNVEAHNYWKDGIRAYEAAEKAGWNKASCSKVSDIFEDAVDAQAKFAEAIYMIGRVHYQCGDKAEALSQYKKALRVNEKLCRARAGLGLDDLENGRASEAERSFRRAIGDDPQCTEAYVNLAILQRRGRDGGGEALKNLRRALAINAQYLPAFNEMALLYVGEADENIKKLDLAEVVCSQAQKIDADYAPVYNTWGLIDLKRDKIIEASAKFQKAFQLDPKMFEAYMNFAQITLGFRGYQDAKVAFEKALVLRPESFAAQIGLGVALRGLEQNEPAIAAYEKAAKLNSGRPEPYYNLGVLWQDFQSGSESDMKKAEGYYSKFLKRAGGEKRFATAVQDVTRKCATKKGRRRRGSVKCVSGRLQNIANYRSALQEMAEMEELQKEAEAQAAEYEAQEKAQQKVAAAEEAKAAEAQNAESADKGKSDPDKSDPNKSDPNKPDEEKSKKGEK